MLWIFSVFLRYTKHVSDNQLSSETFEVTKRIIYGKESSIEESPYMVSLTIQLASEATCAGAILSSKVIITAAHCLYLVRNVGQIQVRAGSSYSKKEGSVHKLKRFKLHEKFNFTNMFNGYDVALIWLKNPIDLKDKETKKAITMFESGEEIREGTIFTFAGWGGTSLDTFTADKIQSLSMRIVDKNDCLKRLSKESLEFNEGFICATSLADNKLGTAYYGDSGGPLVIGDRLAGILSFCHNSTTLPQSQFFIDVSFLREWIDKKRAEFNEEVC